jgi:hypothetical protein
MTAIPSFFHQAPRLRVTDPLADFLGAVQDGCIDYEYVDVVKLAGHSCPTVACAYLMTTKALARLYGEEIPRRGEIRVEMRDAADAGVTGVIAAVVGMLTGAAGAGGFKGIGGRFDRQDLLSFDAPIEGEVRFTRADTGRSVEASAHPEVAPMPPGLRAAIGQALQPGASPAARAAFGEGWQERVRALLVDHVDDPNLIVLSD